MVRISVVDRNDVIKSFFKTTAVIVVTIICLKYIKNKNNIDEYLNNKAKAVDSSNLYSYIETTLPIVSAVNKNLDSNFQEYEGLNNKQNQILNKLLSLQLGVIDNIKYNENIDLVNEELIEEEKKDENNYQEQNYNIADGVDYSKVGSNGKVCGVEIKNNTKFTLDENFLNGDLTIFRQKNKSKILIINSHTSESYTSSPENTYVQTGNFRTQDNNYNVVRVGKALKGTLELYDFNVIQDETCHDYPAYNGSYTRSLETVNKHLQKDNDIEIVFDVHRDAIGSNSSFRPITTVDGKTAAQIMFVVGTSEGGLSHPNWQENLKLAIKIQKKANEMYPGLFRPINLSKSRYNQHTTKGSLIIEVGATGNTLEECLTSMELFGKVISEVIKE